MMPEPVDKARRLFLLLADGSGDFDFIQMVSYENMVYFLGHVSTQENKRIAEQLARYVGFTDVRNAIRVEIEDT